MKDFSRDIIHAWRFIRKHFGFASLIILCLGLGIGVNVAVFSVVNTALLRPLPYGDPERLVILWDMHVGTGNKAEGYWVSPLNFGYWKEQGQTIEQLAAMEIGQYNLTGQGEPVRLEGAAVTANFFSALGVQPLRGRTFQAGEDGPGTAPVAVISHNLWQQHLGADPRILERPIVLDGQSYTVVGILQPKFHFYQEADIWVPLRVDPTDARKRLSHDLFVIGRLRPETSVEKAQTEFSAFAKRLEREYPDSNSEWGVKVSPLREDLIGGLKPALLMLLGAVGFVLLIACANVANLLLIRATERSGEIAIRSALGAKRSRLIRQMLSESVLLALLGGVLGLLLAAVFIKALPVVGPLDLGLLKQVSLDARVLAFTFLLSVLAGLIPALLPVVRASRPGLIADLKNEARRSTQGVQGRRMQSALVVAEIAVALMLLSCTGLMIKSFKLLYNTDAGFDHRNVLIMQVSLPDWKYAEPHQALDFWRKVLGQVQSLPGVVASGITSSLPVNELSPTAGFTVEHREPSVPGELLIANFRRISPDYFRVLKVPVLQGRAFNEDDDQDGLPVVIVSQEMARRFWPHEDPIGKRIQRFRNAPDKTWLTIVGVVGDVHDSILGAEIEKTFYVPFAQSSKLDMYLAVRTSIEPLGLASSVRRQVLSVDKDQPVAEISTLDQWLSRSLSKRRFSTFLLTLSSALGIALAAVGIYGVLSYSVSQRLHEIGVRMALGAQTADVVGLVLRRGMALTLVGLAIGLAMTFLVTRLLSSLLYGVTPTDPVTLLAATATLLTITFMASYLPARRAARVDPITSFKPR